MKRFWRDMPTIAFEEDTSQWIAVLPLAAIEQHGPHLPLGVDAMIAEGLVQRCADCLPQSSKAVFLPLQQVGKSNEHINFPGTLSLDWATAIQSLIEIGEGVAQAGIQKLVLITSHGGNVSTMDIAARELREKHTMMVISTSWAKLGKWQQFYDLADTYVDIHGGQIETSIMLALRPDLVDMDKARDFESNQASLKTTNTHLGYHSSDATISWLAEDLNRNGVVGNAAAASAADGERDIASMAEGFCKLISEIEATAPPDNTN